MRKRKLKRRLTDLKNFFTEVPNKDFFEALRYVLKRIEEECPDAKWFRGETDVRFTLDAEIQRCTLRQGGWRRAGASKKKRMIFASERLEKWR